LYLLLMENQMVIASKTDKSRSVLLQLLRRGPATVDDLARATDLTPNAVRFHLSSLEADGEVQSAGTRRHEGAGKPAVLYMLTPEAEVGFSRAYAPVLAATVQELRAAVPSDQVVPFLKRVGDRLAGAPNQSGRPLSQRVAAGANLLNDLGGSTTVTRQPDRFVIRGQGCPLGAVVAGDPCLCSAVESLLTNVIGAPVTQCCAHGARPSCCFEVPVDG
jgi:DeoR family transcriptional regulator, suf operon transcriptional repressor